MKYLKVYIAQNKKESSLFFKIYSAFFPNSCNKLIDLSDVWVLEFNDEGIINREVGLSSEMKPLIAMPNSKCYGFLSDTQMTYKDFFDKKFNSEKITPEVFKNYWDNMQGSSR
ncbi:hypothetical protein [Jejuia spongiicola]|uniref:Uncharacterized protein n=1 Tax=Jejuia spongiicola TaxID=2942207 RepID=A0ABT0QBM2_9FLAO|nr:hypothetical protein [Jejuia spongiicola]MCL6293888.1 hypothetical protein [Jejuia spongiicola]